MFRDVDEIGPAPAALCAPRPPAEGHRGAVFVLHGLGGEKEDALEDLEHLAAAGYLALALDAVGHGARRDKDLEARLDSDDEAALARAFTDVIEQTAAELPAVIDALSARGFLPAGGVGVVGTSLGGFIALRAPLVDARVSAVVAVSASPAWPEPRLAAPAFHLDELWPTPLLLLHGSVDDVVSPAASRAFVAALAPRYADEPERVRRVEWSGEGHLLGAEAQAAVGRERDAWLSRWLSSS